MMINLELILAKFIIISLLIVIAMLVIVIFALSRQISKLINDKLQDENRKNDFD